MSTITESLKAALDYQRAGQLDEAERIGRQILDAEPQNTHALHLLGSLAHQRGRHAAAADYLTRATMLDPSEPAFPASLAAVKLAMGRPDEAVGCLREVLRLRPDHAKTHNDLGVLLANLGRGEEAADCFRQVLLLEPNYGPAHNNLGNVLNEQGKLTEAIECFRRALAAQPDLVQACNNLANALKAQGQVDEAIAQYREALSIRPDYAEGHYNLALALKDAGKPDEAIACYREALRIRPDFVEARFNLGSLFKAQGLLPEALASFEQVAAKRPDFAEVYSLLGSTLKAMGRTAEARAVLERAIELKPSLIDARLALAHLHLDEGNRDAAVSDYERVLVHNPLSIEAHIQLGNVMRSQGNSKAAADHYRQALAISPECVEAHINLGLLYLLHQRSAEAEACCREALRLAPDDAAAHNALGTALEIQDKLDQALAEFREAVRLQPTYFVAYNNLGSVLRALGKPGEAIVCFEQALKIAEPSPAPADSTAEKPATTAPREAELHAASIHVNRALTLLLTGDLDAGWSEYEWRLRLPDAPRPPAAPRWDGSALAGRTILLTREQGLGDVLQFIRYLPLVQGRLGRVLLAAPRRWLPILRSCAGVDAANVEFCDEAEPLPPFDVHAPLASLPCVFKTDLASIPARVPYLSAPQDLVERWRERLGNAKDLRVAINWHGNPENLAARQRWIPLNQFAPLAGIEGVRLVSVQKVGGLEQLVLAPFPVENLGPELDEGAAALVDTAAVIQNVDLVITNDSAVAHLAGALGVPTWVALPADPDWRWLLDRADSPWYPSLKLFRQSQRGDWAEVFTRIAAELMPLAAAKRGKDRPAKGASTFLD